MTTAERYNEKLANEINRIYDATRELTFSKNTVSYTHLTLPTKLEV